MQEVQLGDTVYCRGLITRTVTADILCIKTNVFGFKKYLCQFRVDNLDFGYSYDVAKWRYRVFK